jgi:hypothetical protein
MNSNRFTIHPSLDDFNKEAQLPYSLKAEHILSAMNDFCNFIDFINKQLKSKGNTRFESMLMPANFSSVVGEYINSTIPKYCQNLVKNNYHNGHPDLIEKKRFKDDAVQHSHHGIEIKASRYDRGWQGHNPESIWLIVFVFECSRRKDVDQDLPFSFKLVCGAKLKESDWKFSGRKEGSRRTITASVTDTGYRKMIKNWIYISPSYKKSLG